MPMRIGVIHPTIASMDSSEAAFEALWPDPVRMNLYDESLYQVRATVDKLTPELYRRVGALIRYSAACGADAVLLTGSFFNPVATWIRPELDIPVLTSYEAIVEEALDRGRRFGLLSSDGDAIRSLTAALRESADARGKEVFIEGRRAEGAIEKLFGGDREGYARLIVETAKALPDCDAVLLAQFSMAPTQAAVAKATGRPVLTVSEATVKKLKAMLAG